MNDRPPPHSDPSAYEHMGSRTVYRRVPSAQYYSFERYRSRSGRELAAGSWVSYAHELHAHDPAEAFEYFYSSVGYITFGHSMVQVAVMDDGQEQLIVSTPIDEEPALTCYIEPTVYLASALTTSVAELQSAVDGGRHHLNNGLHQQKNILRWMAEHDTDIAILPSGMPDAGAVTDRLRVFGPADLAARRVYRTSGGWRPVLYDPREP